jgi:hypothetical protein
METHSKKPDADRLLRKEKSHEELVDDVIKDIKEKEEKKKKESSNSCLS